MDDMVTIAYYMFSLQVDTAAIAGQEIDNDVLNWYVSRFKMFKDDGCPDAVNAYLKRLKTDERVNEVTHLAVLQKSFEFV